MKTAMQTLLEDIEFLMHDTYDALYKKFELDTYYLQKEREQIESAFDCGNVTGLLDKERHGKDYYSTTFKK